MALSIGSQILVSDISNALAGKQDTLGYVPVKSVNGTTADSSGNVAISTGITTVKAQIGSAWGANSTSMTLPSGGTWFVWNTEGDGAMGNIGVGKATGNSSSGYGQAGNTFSGGTKVYAKYQSWDAQDNKTYENYGKLAAVRIA